MRRFQTTVLILILGLFFFSARMAITASTSDHQPSQQSQSSTLAATMAATASVQSTAQATQASAETATPGPESTAEGTAVATAQVDMGYIRFINAAPGAPAIDIYLDNADTATVSNLAFSNATNFIQMAAQKYHLVLRGYATKSDSTPIATFDVDLAVNASINVIALGSTNKQGVLTLATFMTDRSNTQGKARVELVNASPDAPALDLLSGTSPAISNIAAGKSSDKPLNLDPGSYDFSIVPTGKTDPVLIDLKGSALDADAIYTIVVIGAVKDIQPLILASVSPDVSEVPTEATAEATMEATGGATKQATIAATVAATQGK